MNNITTFLANNYIWFLVIGIILIFALIGYIVDSKNIVQEKPKTMKFQRDKKAKEPDKAKEAVPPEPVAEKPKPASDKTEVLETVSLQDAIAKNNNPESIIKEVPKETSTFEK